MRGNVRVPLPPEYDQRVQSLVGLLRWRWPDELRFIETLDDLPAPRQDPLDEPARALEDAVRIVQAALQARGMPCTRETATRAVVRHALAMLGAGASA